MPLPNIISLIRIALVPVVVLVYFSSFGYHYLWAALIFGIASFTDWLDGYLARRLNQVSEFGAFLDPVADKVLVSVVLVLLVAIHPTVWMVLPVGVIIARELLVSALREWMAGKGQREAVKVAFAGKVKTTVQMIAIIVLLASDPDGIALFWQFGFVLIYVAAGLSLYSMYNYYKRASKHLQ